MASNWADADRRRREIDLVCQKCSARNRPGAIIIEIEEDEHAHCGVCKHRWDPRKLQL